MVAPLQGLPVRKARLMEIVTERLRLRPFAPRDTDAFVALNADAEVRRYFPAVLSPEESRAALDRMAARWREDGFGFSAVERLADGVCLGMAGLARIHSGPLAGAVEIGWRLGRAHWRQGYASEAARAWLRHGFDAMGLERIVAYTIAANRPSQQVMERIGMRRTPALDHAQPGLPEDFDAMMRVWTLDRSDWRGS